ncbi:MAG: cupin domain-containing protein [Eubacteriales bacterium]|jgi:gentisate 1,2-dioxygenase
MAGYNDLGNFPANGPQSREEKVFYKLTDDNCIKMISGSRTPALLNVWVSNDVIQFGNIKILTGGPGPQQTEWDSHPGDAVFYIKEGPVTFLIRETKETFNVEEGDFMFIPEGSTYKMINFYGKPAKAVFMVAPRF